jgi:hypothetical protein
MFCNVTLEEGWEGVCVCGVGECVLVLVGVKDAVTDCNVGYVQRRWCGGLVDGNCGKCSNRRFFYRVWQSWGKTRLQLMIDFVFFLSSQSGLPYCDFVS